MPVTAVVVQRLFLASALNASATLAQSPSKHRDLFRTEILRVPLQQDKERRVRLGGAALQFLRRGTLDRLPLGLGGTGRAGLAFASQCVCLTEILVEPILSARRKSTATSTAMAARQASLPATSA
ncbi:hypothetical protein [Xanthomonas medicagonis]|uniref:hypothetical protein n=1 Tax=Xanthomonas medicagonis TaxID=3160841 RepID=UPI00351437A1